jgi:hypothetical protein
VLAKLEKAEAEERDRISASPEPAFAPEVKNQDEVETSFGKSLLLYHSGQRSLLATQLLWEKNLGDLRTQVHCAQTARHPNRLPRMNPSSIAKAVDHQLAGSLQIASSLRV